MLGKRGVSGVFIGRGGASPRSDGGSKSEIRGYGGSKIHSAHPTLNVGYPRVKGAKDCPSGATSSPPKPEWKRRKAEHGTGVQDTPSGRVTP